MLSDDTTSDGSGTSGSGLTGASDVLESVPPLVGETGAVLVGLTPPLLPVSDVVPLLLPEGPTALVFVLVEVGETLVAVGPTGETPPVEPAVDGETVGETVPPVEEVGAPVDDAVVVFEPEGSVDVWSSGVFSPVEQASTKHPSQKLWEEGRSLIIIAFAFPCVAVASTHWRTSRSLVRDGPDLIPDAAVHRSQDRTVVDETFRPRA